MGWVGDLGILAAEDGLVVLDRRSAIQQIEYDRLMNQQGGITLGAPSSLELRSDERERLVAVSSVLADVGVKTEAFGGGTFVVREAPSGIAPEGAAYLVKWAIENGRQAEDLSPSRLRWELAKWVADSTDDRAEPNIILKGLSRNLTKPPVEAKVGGTLTLDALRRIIK